MFSLYLGEPGSGKTTLMKEHVTACPVASVEAFLIVDHAGEWSGLGRNFASIREFRESDTLPRFCVFPGANPHEIAQLCIDIGGTVYVDDECDRAVEDSRWKENPVREILKRGRHLPNARGEVCQVGAMLGTHRPANLPPDVVAMCRRIYIGRLRSFADADRVYREGWIPEATSPREVRAILERRGPGEFSTYPAPAPM